MYAIKFLCIKDFSGVTAFSKPGDLKVDYDTFIGEREEERDCEIGTSKYPILDSDPLIIPY